MIPDSSMQKTNQDYHYNINKKKKPNAPVKKVENTVNKQISVNATNKKNQKSRNRYTPKPELQRTKAEFFKVYKDPKNKDIVKIKTLTKAEKREAQALAELEKLHDQFSSASDDFLHDTQTIALQVESKISKNVEISAVDLEDEVEKLEITYLKCIEILNETCQQLNVTPKELPAKFNKAIDQISTGKKNISKCTDKFIKLYKEKVDIENEYESKLLKLKKLTNNINTIADNKELLKLKTQLMNSSNQVLEYEMGEILRAQSNMLGTKLNEKKLQHQIEDALISNPMYQEVSTAEAKDSIKKALKRRSLELAQIGKLTNLDDFR